MPSVPRSATRLAALAGECRESPVCEPSAVAAMLLAAATAGPPEDASAECDGSQAFHMVP